MKKMNGEEEKIVVSGKVLVDMVLGTQEEGSDEPDNGIGQDQLDGTRDFYFMKLMILYSRKNRVGYDPELVEAVEADIDKVWQGYTKLLLDEDQTTIDFSLLNI